MGTEREPEARQAAAALFARGVTRADAARRLGVSRATATRWFRVWREEGALALGAPGPRGRPPKLDLCELEGLHAALGASPRDSGFCLDRWSLAAVVALIQRQTGIAYHPRHVARVLRRAGWVIPPVGRFAPQAFRELAHADPDGNAILIRKQALADRHDVVEPPL